MTRVLIALALIMSAFGIVVGFALAFFGSQADTSVPEQSACLWTGIGMVGVGFCAFPLSLLKQRKWTLPCVLAAQIALYGAACIWGFQG